MIKSLMQRGSITRPMMGAGLAFALLITLLAAAVLVNHYYHDHDHDSDSEEKNNNGRPPLTPFVMTNENENEDGDGRERKAFSRMIHHVWISNDPMPEMWRPNLDQWQALHPGWPQQIWDKHACRQLVEKEYSWYLPFFDTLTLRIQVADVCRYFLLHAKGGVYADLDMYPRISFEPILQEAERKHRRVLILERYKDPQAGAKFDASYLAIGMLASAPGAAFWLNVFKVLKERATTFDPMNHLLDHYRVIHQTGPHCLMAAYFQDSRAVGLLRQELFFPCDIICAPIDACIDKHPEAVLLIGYGRTWNGAFTLGINWLLCHLSIQTLLHVTCPLLLTLLWILLYFSAQPSSPPFLCFWSFLGIYVAVMLFSPLSPYGFYALLWGLSLLLFTLHSLSSSSSFFNVFKSRQSVILGTLCAFLILLLSLHLHSLLYSSSSSLIHIASTQDVQFPSLVEESPPAVNILLIVERPGDESALFLPTIRRLQQLGAEIHIMCTGAGITGAEIFETRWAARLLGVNVEHVAFIEVPPLNLKPLLKFLREHAHYRFSAIVTTDRDAPSFISSVYGATHTSIYRSVRAAASSIMLLPRYTVTGELEDMEEACPLKLYVVRTPPIWRRYLGPFAFLFSPKQDLAEDRLSLAVFEPALAWGAMTAHVSSISWHRLFFALFGSAQYVNDLAPLYDISVDRIYDEPSQFVTSAVTRTKQCPLFHASQ